MAREVVLQLPELLTLVFSYLPKPPCVLEADMYPSNSDDVSTTMCKVLVNSDKERATAARTNAWSVVLVSKLWHDVAMQPNLWFAQVFNVAAIHLRILSGKKARERVNRLLCKLPTGLEELVIHADKDDSALSTAILKTIRKHHKDLKRIAWPFESGYDQLVRKLRNVQRIAFDFIALDQLFTIRSLSKMLLLRKCGIMISAAKPVLWNVTLERADQHYEPKSMPSIQCYAFRELRWLQQFLETFVLELEQVSIRKNDEYVTCAAYTEVLKILYKYPRLKKLVVDCDYLVIRHFSGPLLASLPDSATDITIRGKDYARVEARKKILPLSSVPLHIQHLRFITQPVCLRAIDWAPQLRTLHIEWHPTSTVSIGELLAKCGTLEELKLDVKKEVLPTSAYKDIAQYCTSLQRLALPLDHRADPTDIVQMGEALNGRLVALTVRFSDEELLRALLKACGSQLRQIYLSGDVSASLTDYVRTTCPHLQTLHTA